MTTPKATHQLQGSILAITPCEDSTFVWIIPFILHKSTKN